jgi:hypothetical protein
VTVNLTSLGLVQFTDYDFYESFNGDYLGKYHNTDSYSFTINPAGDVHAFYAESAIPTKRFRKKL